MVSYQSTFTWSIYTTGQTKQTRKQFKRNRKSSVNTEMVTYKEIKNIKKKYGYDEMVSPVEGV